MPTVTRWMIKSSLLFFVAALIIRFIQSLSVLQEVLPWISVLGSVYFHLFMVGWISQLIFGVVYWMFPKQSAERPRGSESLAWAVFWLLNIGLLLRAIGEPLNALEPGKTWGILLAASALLQWLAGMAFVVNTWSRVKER